MPTSSDSIGQLAGALAKAQAELVNPPKSLTAVIEAGPGREPQRYRYAPLSTGLTIVRKTLGRHELAVVQTTDARSGEWRGGADDHAGARLGRMDRHLLAGLSRARPAAIRSSWAPPSPMPAATACSPWSDWPARMILMRLISSAREPAPGIQRAPMPARRAHGRP